MRMEGAELPNAIGVCFRVCTVQYFVWYFCLLPLVLPASRLGPRDGAWLFAGWGGAQLLWLAAAGALEMGGKLYTIDATLGCAPMKAMAQE